MRKSERDKRTYLIIGLCAVLVVMVVGFAAFSSQLQINGTSNISSNWDVQITNITRFASSGSGVSDVSGSPSYDNSNGLTATFNTNLTSPGDYAIYKIKIENFGSLNAKLSKITLNAGTSDDITYYVNKNELNEDIYSEYPRKLGKTDNARRLEEGDVLKPTGDSSNLDEGYVYVTVKYNNYEGQSSPTGGNKSVSATVKLDFVQSNSNATPTPATFTGTIYRNNTTNAMIGGSIVPVSGTKYVITNGQYESPLGPYDTLEECNADKVAKGAPDVFYCQQKTGTFGGIGEYTTDASTLNKSYYLKHDVIDDIITASYACFIINNTEYCMKASSDGSTWSVNKGLLGTLKDAGTITCSDFGDYSAACSGDGIGFLYAGSSGRVYAGASNRVSCYADNSGISICYDNPEPEPDPEPEIVEDPCDLNYTGSEECIPSGGAM